MAPHREQVLALIGEVLDSGQLSNGGPYVAELERRVAALHDVRHCVATCNGTLALELALRAAQLTGEVVVPSFTFIATVHAVSRAGLVPVFADVDPVTHNLDPTAAERVITARTSAILGVHLWGRPCDVEGLSAVADRDCNSALVASSADLPGDLPVVLVFERRNGLALWNGEA